jgi:hypothetical protein
MNYRNAKHLNDNRIDCEIEHPDYGWIPFTCDPTDTGAAFDVVALFDAMAADSATATYVPPTQVELDAVQTSARIAELKQLLASTDYVALADYDKSKPDVLAQRQAWREELRALEVI